MDTYTVLEESCKSSPLQQGGRLCEDKVGMNSGDWNLPWSCHSPHDSFTFISFADTPLLALLLISTIMFSFVPC